MAKIYLQSESQPIIVSEEEGLRILNEKNDPKHKGTVMVHNRAVQKGKIREIALGNGTAGAQVRTYNLDVPADRQIIKEFEKMLDDRAAHATLMKPIENYGRSHADFVLNHPEMPARPGYVFHPLLGLVHWSTVQYALDENLISTKYNTWSIVSHGLDDQINVSAYLEFESKLKALYALKGRRNHAQNRDLDALSTMREEVVEKSAMPLPF